MDYSYVSYSFTIPKPLILLLHVIDLILYCVSALLYHLGLYPSFDLVPAPLENHAYILIAAEYLVSSVSPTTLKSKLAVVEYGNWKKKKKNVEACGGDESMCAVCLGVFGLKHEVRELGNCHHVFHKDCIDEWIDMGKVTCPLCRSELLPAKEKGGMGLFFLKLLKKI